MMHVFNGMIVISITLSIYVNYASAQDVCTAAEAQSCAPYRCVKTGTVYSCVCPDLSITQSAAACNSIIVTQPPITPNQCGNGVCPAGSTCIPTNQNPSQYICLCPNNIIANPNCPITPFPNNPCLNNPCRNGGTCVVDTLTQGALCLCPPNTYGSRCLQSCARTCDVNWCYNGGRCTSYYGQAYCSCPRDFRGRRCELRNNRYNYVYLYNYLQFGK